VALIRQEIGLTGLTHTQKTCTSNLYQKLAPICMYPKLCSMVDRLCLKVSGTSIAVVKILYLEHADVRVSGISRLLGAAKLQSAPGADRPNTLYAAVIPLRSLK